MAAVDETDVMVETDVTPAAGGAMGVTVVMDEMAEVVATVVDAMEAAVTALAVTVADVMAPAAMSSDGKVAGGNRCHRWDVMANHVKVESAVLVLRLTVRRGKVSPECHVQTLAMHRDVRWRNRSLDEWSNRSLRSRTCRVELVSPVAFLRLLEIHRMVVDGVRCLRCVNDQPAQVVVKPVSHSTTNFVDRVSIKAASHAQRSLVKVRKHRR